MRLCFLLILLISLQGLSGQSIPEKTLSIYNDYNIEYSRGNFLLAKEYLDDLEPFKDSLPDYTLAVIQNAYGLVNWRLGNYRESRLYYDSAIHTCSGKDTNSIKLLSVIYNNFGLLLNQEGEYKAAIEYYQQAEDQLNSFPASQEYYVEIFSKLQYNTGIVYYKLGQYEEAKSYLDSALSLKKGYGLSRIGNVYFNLARCFEKSNDPEKAESYYRESIRQLYTEFDSTYFELGTVFLEYAQFLSDQGNDTLAIEYFTKATQNFLQNYGFTHPYTAGCYNLIGDFYLKQKKYQKALDNLQLALASISPGFESKAYDDNPTNNESLMDLGLLKIYRSKINTLREYANSVLESKENSSDATELLNAAVETAKDAIRVLSRIQESYLTQESRLYLIDNQNDFFLSGIAVTLQLYKLTEIGGYQDLAYQFSAAGKAMELRFEMKEKNELYLRSLQDSASLNLLTLKEEIDGYTNMIQMEQMKVESDSAKISEWQQSRFDLRREYESTHKKLFGRELESGNADWFDEDLIHTISSKLRRNESLVEYSISDPDTAGTRNLYAFVISPKDSRVYQTVLPLSFDGQVKTVEDHLYDFSPASLEKDHLAELRESLHHLYIDLIEPIESWFPGKSLIIIPDRELLFIPFDALMRGKPQEADLYSSNSYLVRDYSISYLPVSGFLHKPAYRMVRKKPRLSIVAQDYALNSRGSYSTLAGVRQEVDAIQKLMKTRLLDYEGSKDLLKSDFEKSRLLHFALHSYPSSEEQDASYLVLNSQSDSTNNLLFDYEVEPLNLSDDMVVLNSCESGGGQQIDGEGMMSFSRSFMLAGAKSVVQALWPVDDKSGSTIIVQLYKDLLRGRDKPDALQKAQINYLESCSPSFTHPYFWAGYQIIGETGPIAAPITRSGMIVAGIFLIGFLIWLRKRQLNSDMHRAT